MSDTRKPELAKNPEEAGRLQFEQVVYLVNEKMASTRKSVHVLPGTDDFRHLLPKLKLSADGDEAFIYIRPFVHSMAIYMRNVKGKIICFIGDSQGWQWRYYPTRRIVDAIYRQFDKSAKIILPNTQLQDQDEQKGCVAISVATLEYCARHGKDFCEALEETDVLEKGSGDRTKLEKGLHECGIDRSFIENNIVCLAENKLPEAYVKSFESYFSYVVKTKFWDKDLLTISQKAIDEIYEEYRKLTQHVHLENNEKSWENLRKGQHLSPDYFTPSPENPAQYDIKIRYQDGKYILAIEFGRDKGNLESFLYNDSLVYSDCAYPSQVKVQNLKNIFSNLKVQSHIDSANNALVVTADTFSELESAIDQLADPSYQYQLHQSGMSQQFALSQFIYEARERLQMEICKEEKTGGLYLNDVNAALKYFVGKLDNKNVVVLQEAIGITNEKLAKNALVLLNAGYKQVVFSCTLDSTHQVAVIVNSETKKITVIDSEGKPYAHQLKQPSGKNFDIPFFAGYSLEDKKPIVLQQDEWACGVHVAVNILDELGDIPDRKSVDIDTWLRKILRASAAVKRDDFLKQEKEDTFRNIISILTRITPDISDVKNTKIGELVNLLKEINGTQLASLEAFTQHPTYKEFYKGLDEPAQELLTFSYALSELEISRDNLEKILPEYVAILSSPIASHGRYKNNPKQEKLTMTLGKEISNVIGYEFEGTLDDFPDITDKLKWLRTACLSISLAEDKWSALNGVMSPEMKDGLKKMVKEYNADSDVNIQNWVVYLCMSRLATTTQGLAEAETAKKVRMNAEAAQQSSKSKEEANNKKIEEIQNQLGPDADKYTERLEVLKNFKDKLAKCSIEGWVEIVKNVELNTELMHKIFSDYEVSSTTNFYLSVMKSLWQMQKSDLGGKLLLSHLSQNTTESEPNIVFKQIVSEGGYYCLEILNFITPEQQKVFLKQQTDLNLTTLDLIKDFIEVNVYGHESFTMDFKNLDEICGFFEAVLLPKGASIARLPPYFVMQLLPELEKNIQNVDHLIKVLSVLPEENRVGEARKFQYLIQDGYGFARVLEELPKRDRFEFTAYILSEVVNAQEVSNFISHSEVLRRIMECLEDQERHLLMQKPFFDELVFDGYVIGQIIKLLNGHEQLPFIEKYKSRITEANHIPKILKSLGENDKWPFINKYAYLIKDGSDLENIFEHIPENEKLQFANRYRDILTNIEDIVAVTNKLKDDDQLIFVSQFEEVIQSYEDLRQFLAYYPLDKCWDLVKDHLDKIVGGRSIAHMLKNLPPDKYVELIKAVVKDKDEFMDVLAYDPLPIQLMTALINTLDEENSLLVNSRSAKDFDVMLLSMEQQSRYDYAIKHKTSVQDVFTLKAILYSLQPDERVPFLKNCDFPFSTSLELRETLVLIDEKNRWLFMQDFMSTPQFEVLFNQGNFVPKYFADMLMENDRKAFSQKIQEFSQSRTMPSLRNINLWSTTKVNEGSNQPIQSKDKKPSNDAAINDEKKDFKNE